MSRDDDASYNDSHRAFLQAFMARGTLTFSEARPLLASILGAYEGRPVAESDVTEEEDFSSYINTVSNAVSEFDYEVRSTVRQRRKPLPSNDEGGGVDGNIDDEEERVYALINSTSDNLTQLATSFSPDELAFVKRVLDDMFERNNTLRHELCAVTGRDALNLHRVKDTSATNGARSSRRDTQSNTLTQGMNGNNSNSNSNNDGDGDDAAAAEGGTAQSITMAQAQTVLQTLVAQGWFERSRKDYYSLSPRALMELRTWLVDAYNDEDDENEDGGGGRRIKMCQACNDIITVGQRCPKLDCPVRLHHACTRRFFRVHKGAERCPRCNSDWAAHGLVGESAAHSGPRRSVGATTGQTAAAAAATAARRRTSASGMDGAEEEDDDDNEND